MGATMGERQTRLMAGGTVLGIVAAFAAYGAIPDGETDVVPLSIPLADASLPSPELMTSVAGATGTMPLPDLPIPPEAASVAAPTGIVAARPFLLRGSMLDQSRALQCLTTAIYYEAANEPDAGQRAVAQVVLNRVRHPAFPATVCGVVFQGSDKRGCQFSFACDGAMARAPVRRWWDRAQRVAADALNGHVFAPAGLATHYHTYAVTPAWNRELVMTDVEGAHFFHRWKGFWGTPAAFLDRYAGGEPMPGPLRALTVASAAPVAATAVAISPTPVARSLQPAASDLAAALVPKPQGAYENSGASAVAHSDDSQILDKWKNSGQLIR